MKISIKNILAGLGFGSFLTIIGAAMCGMAIKLREALNIPWGIWLQALGAVAFIIVVVIYITWSFERIFGGKK